MTSGPERGSPRPGRPWLAGGVLGAALLTAGLPVIVAAWLAVAGAGAAVTSGDPAVAAGVPSPGGTPAAIALRTLGWSLSVAIAAALVGWIPGRHLGRAIAHRRPAVVVLVLLPVALPAYAVFFAWWQAWPAGSPLFARISSAGLVAEARQLTLFISLVAWAWPLVALAVATASGAIPADRAAAWRLDRVPRRVRWARTVRAEWTAALGGAAIVAALVAGDTIAFDLAQVYTTGNELRAMDALGRPAGEIVRMAAPIAVAAGLAGAVAWIAVRSGRRAGASAAAPPVPGRAGLIATAVAVVFGAAIPGGLLVAGLAGRADAGLFLDLYRETVLRSAALAIGVGLLTGGIAAASVVGLATARPWARRLTVVAGIVALAGFVLPPFAWATAAEHLWNRGWPGGAASSSWSPATLVYGTPVILLLAGVGRTLAPGLLLAAQAAGRVRDPETRDLVRLDRPRGLLAPGRIAGPSALRAGIATAAVAAVITLSDAAVIPRLAPPGFDPLSSRLLNAMHYQRGDVVLLGLAAVLLLALLAGAAVAWSISRGCGSAGPGPGLGRRRWRTARVIAPARGALLIAAAAILFATPGCAPSTDAGGESVPLPARATHGGPGTLPGRFSYPRAIAADPVRERLYVIDKTARVQVFDTDGDVVGGWRMPEFSNGKPTGISVGPDGTVWVADTHYHRIIAFEPDGTERFRFGSVGEGPGQFIYPTDVAVGADGRLYVSEYGGNDRIQIFSPGGTPLASFGAFGDGPEDFNRPQALLFSPDRTRLYVADACNHRIVVLDPDGRRLGTIASAGRGPGEVHYPYDLAWLDTDRLIVSEFGNNRIQVMDVDGTPRGRFGLVGTGEGMLKYPWGAVRVGDRVFVLDSGNNRLVEVPRGRLM